MIQTENSIWIQVYKILAAGRNKGKAKYMKKIKVDRIPQHGEKIIMVSKNGIKRTYEISMVRNVFYNKSRNYWYRIYIRKIRDLIEEAY